MAHLQRDPAEYMGMPAANPKDVFIIREAFDVSRFEAGAGPRNPGRLQRPSIVTRLSGMG
ncbi:MAG TPA: hypothetical protein VK579_19210 [Terriglobales bacterium]|nr:hypothetical protein [Terriglobales bacterium]